MVNNYMGSNFQEEIQNRVLVDFYANWCGPCKMLGPVLEKISDEVKVLKVNVDENQDLAREYGVMSIPCVILFDKGKEIKRSVGFMPEAKLREFIKDQVILIKSVNNVVKLTFFFFRKLILCYNMLYRKLEVGDNVS